LEFIAEVLKVFLTDLQLQHFFDHRRKVCQRADGSQRRSAGGPYEPPDRSENEGVLHRFHRHTPLVQLRREHPIGPSNHAAGTRSRAVGSQKPAHVVGLFHTDQPCGSRNDGPLMVTVWQ